MDLHRHLGELRYVSFERLEGPHRNFVAAIGGGLLGFGIEAGHIDIAHQLLRNFRQVFHFDVLPIGRGPGIGNFAVHRFGFHRGGESGKGSKEGESGDRKFHMFTFH